MATAAPITGAIPHASKFRLNGVQLLVNDPATFMEQAHGAALCLAYAVGSDTSPNEQIVRAAAQGLATLIELAAISLDEVSATRTSH